MAKKLFQTQEELIQGYGLSTQGKDKRKVYLIGRPLASGNISLQRYSCNNNKRQRVSTGAILVPELSLEDKRTNEEVLRVQRIEADVLNAELTRQDSEYCPVKKSSVNLIDFIEEEAEREYKRTGKRNSFHACFHSLAVHIEMCFGHNVTFKDVDKQWIIKFLNYLKYDAVNLNYIRTKDENKKKDIPLSENSRVRLFRNLGTILGRAKNYISVNPIKDVEKEFKPKWEQGTREYLELEEVKQLIATPFPKTTSTADFKNAFIFACLTGLRYSDLRRLSSSKMQKSSEGWYTNTKMVKTDGFLKIFIDEQALSLIPERERTPDEPFFKLPKNANANDNKAFKKWFEDAGISKHITWHCARHTTATVMLSNGISIGVVAKQLGHTKTSTTEIYAKIVDKAQAEASKKLTNLIM